jgi:hypothetical protein
MAIAPHRNPNQLKGNTVLKLELYFETNGQWVVWNRTHNTEFTVEFQHKEQAMEFITELTFKFFKDRVN